MRHPAYPAFGLTLVVNHACNLRCAYCYTGTKSHAPMPLAIGTHAIRRALASLTPDGHLELAFFGGEPLLAAASILAWMEEARRAARQSGRTVHFGLTTNGTITSEDANRVLAAPDLDLAVSCDGAPATQDRHRRDARGHPTSAIVERHLRALVHSGRRFTVVMVVRPDTAADLPANLAHLRSLGVTRFTLSLDAWAAWTGADLELLRSAVEAAADLWCSWLPGVGIDWFDMGIAALARLGSSAPALRCGFGEGELAVSPRGGLYPCERLVGAHDPAHPLRLPGRVIDGDDFLDLTSPGAPCPTDGSTCRCSAFVRTGATDRFDPLPSALQSAVNHALERLIRKNAAASPFPSTP